MEQLTTCMLLLLATENGWCMHGRTDDFETVRTTLLAEVARRGEQDHSEDCPECAALAAYDRRQTATADSEPMAPDLFGCPPTN